MSVRESPDRKHARRVVRHFTDELGQRRKVGSAVRKPDAAAVEREVLGDRRLHDLRER